jgi:glucosamine 6-phosphate synthetase-like amidotransferase/phosphosugar isomerase protein
MTTVFEEEIRSQGDVLRRRAELGMQQARDAAASWSDVNYALVAARGSSDNAAVFFQYLAGQELGLLVALATPSLFDGETSIGLDGAGVLAVSQSGRTPGLVEVVERANALALLGPRVIGSVDVLRSIHPRLSSRVLTNASKIRHNGSALGSRLGFVHSLKRVRIPMCQISTSTRVTPGPMSAN